MAKSIVDTITFSVTLNPIQDKSRIQPIGRMVSVDDENKRLFMSSNEKGSARINTGEPVFIMHELADFIPVGEYTMEGHIKKVPNKEVWYFTPKNVKAFFQIFGKSFNEKKRA